MRVSDRAWLKNRTAFNAPCVRHKDDESQAITDCVKEDVCYRIVCAGAPSIYSPQSAAGPWNDPPVLREAAKVFHRLSRMLTYFLCVGYL